MKLTFLGLLALLLLGPSLAAQDLSRTFVQSGPILTVGQDSGWAHPGGGAAIRTFTLWDPHSTQGWYYGWASGALFRVIGSTTLADVRLVTWGWRGDPVRWWGRGQGPLLFDVSLSPTLGSRIRDRQILGSLYTGVGLTLGVYWSLWPDQDIGVSWEPNLAVTTWGDPEVDDRTYSDFVVSWTMKMRTETRRLPWAE